MSCVGYLAPGCYALPYPVCWLVAQLRCSRELRYVWLHVARSGFVALVELRYPSFTRCPSCGCPGWLPVARSTPFGYPFAFVRCPRCALPCPRVPYLAQQRPALPSCALQFTHLCAFPRYSSHGFAFAFTFTAARHCLGYPPRAFIYPTPRCCPGLPRSCPHPSVVLFVTCLARLRARLRHPAPLRFRTRAARSGWFVLLPSYPVAQLPCSSVQVAHVRVPTRVCAHVLTCPRFTHVPVAPPRVPPRCVYAGSPVAQIATRSCHPSCRLPRCPQFRLRQRVAARVAARPGCLCRAPCRARAVGFGLVTRLPHACLPPARARCPRCPRLPACVLLHPRWFAGLRVYGYVYVLRILQVAVTHTRWLVTLVRYEL